MKVVTAEGRFKALSTGGMCQQGVSLTDNVEADGELAGSSMLSI